MPRHLPTIFSALVVLVSSHVSAGPASDKIAQRVLEPFPGYARKCGYPILFANVSTVSLARIHARFGKIIVLDPILTYPAQGAHRRFLIAHECAHHRLDHTAHKGLWMRRTVDKGVEDQELSADCWAAETLVAAGLGHEVRGIAEAFYRKGLHSPGSGYPSGVQRSTLIYHCMKSAYRRLGASTLATETPLSPR